MAEWIATFPGFSQALNTTKKAFGRVIQTGPTPEHVGIIMDGNRRFARSHKIELKEGHNMGFESMASILELLYESGVKYATVYAFSIENFKRLAYEVEWLMDLAKLKLLQLSQHGDLCEKYGIRIKVLGNVRMLPEDVRGILHETELMTKGNNRATLNVCFPYTSREEMTHAIKEVVDKSSRDRDFIIDETAIDNALYTAGAPPLDLLVRTSGTYRLSDFLLWQCVSSSCAVFFSKKLWPEFTPWDMCKILVLWSFNTFWYGHGSGYRTLSTHSRKTVINRALYSTDDLVPLRSQHSSSGFQRYDSYEDNDIDRDDDQSDVKDSEFGVDEMDTNTSEDEPDGKA